MLYLYMQLTSQETGESHFIGILQQQSLSDSQERFNKKMALGSHWRGGHKKKCS